MFLRIQVVFLMLAPAAFCQMGGFGGARGFGTPGTINAGGGGGSQQFPIRPWASVMGTYYGSLRSADGTNNDEASGLGAMAMLGVGGNRAWARTVLSVAYTGKVQYYDTANSQLRQNHIGAVSVAHQASEHLQVGVSQTGGTTLGGFGLGAGLLGLGMFGGMGGMSSVGGGIGTSMRPPGLSDDLDDNGLVDSENETTRTNFSTSTGYMNYRLTARTSVGAAGGASFVRRSGSQYGLNAQNAAGYASYVLSERDQISVQVNSFWLQYPNYFGNVSGVTTGLAYSRMINSRLYFSVYGGVSRLSSSFVGTVLLPPDLAEILGQSTSLAIQEQRYTTGSFGGMVSRSFSQSRFQILARRGLNPGNGVLFAGTRDVVSARYTYSGIQRIGLYGSLTGTKTNSVVAYSNQFWTYMALVGCGFGMRGDLHFTANVGYRVQQLSGSSRGSSISAMVGITWSPRQFGIYL